jgi:hypothetical protein
MARASVEIYKEMELEYDRNDIDLSEGNNVGNMQYIESLVDHHGVCLTVAMLSLIYKSKPVLVTPQSERLGGRRGWGQNHRLILV